MVAIAQLTSTSDVAANAARCVALIARAAAARAQVCRLFVLLKKVPFQLTAIRPRSVWNISHDSEVGAIEMCASSARSSLACLSQGSAVNSLLASPSRDEQFRSN